MAKLILQGNKEMEIPNDMALQIKEDMISGRSNSSVYEVGVITVRGRLINQVYVDGETKENERYDLDNPEHKQIIRQYEREWNNFCESVEKKYRTFICFLWKSRAIVCKGEPVLSKTGKMIWPNFEVYSPSLYAEYVKKDGGLSELLIRRKYSEKTEEQAQENLTELEEVKKPLWRSNATKTEDIYKNDAEIPEGIDPRSIFE